MNQTNKQPRNYAEAARMRRTFLDYSEQEFARAISLIRPAFDNARKDGASITDSISVALIHFDDECIPTCKRPEPVSPTTSWEGFWIGTVMFLVVSGIVTAILS